MIQSKAFVASYPSRSICRTKLSFATKEAALKKIHDQRCERFQCRCGAKVQTEDDLKRHIISFHSFCDVFGRVRNYRAFESAGEVDMTLRSSMLDNISLEPCRRCDKVFAFRHQLQSHIINDHYVLGTEEGKEDSYFPEQFFIGKADFEGYDSQPQNATPSPPKIGGDSFEISPISLT